ncbi:MAG: VTT domain-containing protein [Candidatus Diapherotrites archaeon]
MARTEKKRFAYAKPLALTIAVLAVIVLVVYVSFFADIKSVEGTIAWLLKTFGLPGLFVAAIIANSTIVLPLPLDFIVFPLGEVDFYGLGFFSPVAVGIAVGFGAAIGELSGYFFGFMGAKGIEKLKHIEMKRLAYVKGLVYKYGAMVIFFFALVPSVFDFVGISAGLIKFDVRKFFLACAAGKITRYILIGYFGRIVIDFLYHAHFF